MATHDLKKLHGPIQIRLSNPEEQFISLDGKSEKVNQGEVVYADHEQVIGRFSKQCKQTMTTNDSTDLLFVAFGNSEVSNEKMDIAVKEACELIIKYNGGSYRLIGHTIPKFPLQLRVGKIIEVNNHPQADSLYLLKVDFTSSSGEKNNSGTEIKQVVAGLKKYLSTEDLLNRKAVFCMNIKPAKIRGETSEAMVLAPDDGIHVTLIDAEKTPVGEVVHFQGLESASGQITFEEFTQLVMQVQNVDAHGKGKIMFEGKKLSSKGEDLTASGVKEGARVR